MKQLCRIVDGVKVVYEPREVLAGPHEWEFGGLTFKTVLVRMPDQKRGELSCVDVRSGYRLCKVTHVTAPKTKPSTALFRTSEALSELETRVSTKTMVDRIRNADPISEHAKDKV